ncbi:MAG: DsrE family protein [Sphingomonadaceae bacterium]
MDKLRQGKNVVVLIRRSPLGSLKASEGLRMAVGQSMAHRVTVLLVDTAVWLAGPLKPELVEGGGVGKHLGMLTRLKQRVWVEASSMERYGLEPSLLREGVSIVSGQEIDEALLAADAVVVY